jgi:TP901 family phage tail tape measure protein
MNQFGLGADQAVRIADVLTKAARESNSSVTTLATSLAKTGPVARQFGISLEETVAVLTAAADAGVIASISGTGLQRVLIQLRSPTEEARLALERLFQVAGPEAWNRVNPEKVGLSGALLNLAKAGLTVQDAVSLVDTEFASLLTTFTTSIAKSEDMKAALLASGGDAASQAAAGANTLAAVFADLRSSAEQFAVSVGRGGAGAALQAIARTGADVFRILADDKKAMDEAGIAAKALATGFHLAAVAAASFAALKVATTIASITQRLREAATATLLFDAAIGTVVGRVGGATKAFAGLTAVLRANPFVAAATAVAGVVSTLYVFGSRSDEAAEKAKQQAEEVESLAKQNETLLRAVRGVTQGPGLFAGQGEAEANLRSTQSALQALGKELEGLKGQRVPIEKILAFAELSGAESQLGRIQELLKTLPEVQERARTRTDAAGTRVVVGEFEQQAATLGLTPDKPVAAVDERAKAADISLARFGLGAKTDESSAVAALIRERERELDLALKVGVEREKAILIAEAEKRAGEGVTGTEKEKLALLAQQIVDGQKLIEQRRREAQEAEKLAEQQRELPKNLAELQQKYEQELEIARAVGLERELIRADQEAENEAKRIGLALDSDALAALKEKAREAARLAFEERREKREARVDRRQDEALIKLRQEEQLLKLVGGERDRFRRRIEAENEARQAGLAVGSDEFADYVRRKAAVDELNERMAEGAAFGRDFGASWSDALFEFIRGAERSRDIARALGEDLLRLAYRQTVANNLQRLFEIAGAALAGYFAGGSTPTSGPNSATGSSGLTSQSSTAGGNLYFPRLTGGVIPAMGGPVLDEFGFLRRAGKTYSFAEGGKSTPEAIFPLERHSRGRLGVVAADGGGGGGTIVMNFPHVRTAADARAARATVGQQVRRMLDADRRGRRGLRPRE